MIKTLSKSSSPQQYLGSVPHIHAMNLRQCLHKYLNHLSKSSRLVSGPHGTFTPCIYANGCTNILIIF